MKTSKFGKEQIAYAMRQVEGDTAVAAWQVPRTRLNTC